MPRVFCNFCGKGHVKVPLAVHSLTFRCPKCNALVSAVTEWERQRLVGTSPTILPRLLAIVTEVDNSIVGAEQTSRPIPTPVPNRDPAADLPPVRFETQLTSPHPCTQCGYGIRAPLGCDRATVVCPACSNRTSLYAVIFRCACGAMLEAPVGREGQTDVCPACSRSVHVPTDALRTAPDEQPLEAWFRFDCAECARSVAARREDAGVAAVCPHCRCPIEVPHIGEAITNPTAAAEPNPGEILQAGSEMRCPACETRISTRAERCHVCGQENRQ